MKGEQPIVCLTAYDFPSGEWADSAGVDLVLVGDSLGNVVQGRETTLPVSLAEMTYHTSLVARAVKNALLVADMPFGSYQAGVGQAVESAVQLMKAGAEAVKLEGDYTDEIRALIKAGIPVMGHVGMTPQSFHKFGGFKVQGREDQSAVAVRQSAEAIAEAGAFSIVLELVPMSLARDITDALPIPTIGIGAGPYCDGQIQVLHDVVGFSAGVFKHAKRYAEGRQIMVDSLKDYASDVRTCRFPTEDHAF